MKQFCITTQKSVLGHEFEPQLPEPQGDEKQ